MTDSCPRCAAAVTYFASDVGGTVTCRGCGTLLSVSPDGLSRAAGPSAEAAAPVRAPATAVAAAAPAAEAARPAGAFDLVGWTLSWLFLPGLFLTVVFVFLPIVERAGLASLEAAAIDADLPYTKARQELDRKKEEKRDDVRRKDRELQFKRDEVGAKRRDIDRRRNQLYSKPAAPPQAEIDALRKEEDALHKEEEEALYREEDQLRDERQKLENSLSKTFKEESDKLDREQKARNERRDRLELDRRAAEAASLRRGYWYNWGLFAGLLVLMAGAVGYLSDRNSAMRRAVGAVVLAGLALLVVAKLNSGRGVLFAQEPAHGNPSDPLAAYNLTSPRNTLASALDMVADEDFYALIALFDEGGVHNLRDVVGKVRQFRSSVQVHKEVRWGDNVTMFITYQIDQRTGRATPTVHYDARTGTWRPVYSYQLNVFQANPELAQEMVAWGDRTEVFDLGPGPLFGTKKSAAPGAEFDRAERKDFRLPDEVKRKDF
jgi:hypothetical protein